MIEAEPNFGENAKSTSILTCAIAFTLPIYSFSSYLYYAFFRSLLLLQLGEKVSLKIKKKKKTTEFAVIFCVN